MSHRVTLRGETFVFADLRELFGRANEEKSGDQLAGVAAKPRAAPNSWPEPSAFPTGRA